MGIAPLSAQEIAAWSAGTAHRMTPLEFELIHAASAAFVSEYHAENREPPDGQDLPKQRLGNSFSSRFASLSS